MLDIEQEFYGEIGSILEAICCVITGVENWSKNSVVWGYEGD